MVGIPRINDNQKDAIYLLALWIVRNFNVSPLFALEIVFSVREEKKW